MPVDLWMRVNCFAPTGGAHTHPQETFMNPKFPDILPGLAPGNIFHAAGIGFPCRAVQATRKILCRREEKPRVGEAE